MPPQEPQENLVRIVEWPERPMLAHCEHGWDDSTAHVVVRTDEPMRVEMGMTVAAPQTIPVCIKVCEPICAQSEYTIAIDVFDRPVAAITIRGLTRLFNCREQHEPPPTVATHAA